MQFINFQTLFWPFSEVAIGQHRLNHRGAMHVSAAGNRKYIAYEPDLLPGETAPLIVMLHGCKQTADEFAADTGMSNAAAARKCFVLDPQQSRSSNPFRCWNWFKGPSRAGVASDCAAIESMVRSFISSRPINGRRVYVAGLSAGAAMALQLAQSAPDLFAAVCSHSGMPVGVAKGAAGALSAMRSGPSWGARSTAESAIKYCPPLMVFQSLDDNVVHPTNGDLIFRQHTSLLAYSKTIASVVKGREGGVKYKRTIIDSAPGVSIAEYWELEGLGHCWSGGARSGDFVSVDGPCATELMLTFFLSHER